MKKIILMFVLAMMILATFAGCEGKGDSHADCKFQFQTENISEDR